MYQSIQACRALAALMVVALHAAASLNRDVYLGPAADTVRRLTAFGDAGVPFFFVLSGFIVTHAHLRDFDQPGRVPAYLLKRAARIYPMYWIVFLLTALPALLLSSAGVQMPQDALTLIKTWLLLPQDPAVVGGTGAPVVFVAWTLQYEMVFYAVMALALLRRWLLLAPLVLYVLNQLSRTPGESFWRDFFAHDLLCLFAMGAGLAALARHLRPWSTGIARAMCVSAALGFLAMAVWRGMCFPQECPPHRELLLGVITTVGIAGLTRLEEAGWRLSPHGWLVKLGHASYTLYLIQVPLVSLFSKAVLAATAVLPPIGQWGAGLATALIVAACALAALGMHRLVEQPIMQRVGRWMAR